MKKKLVKKIDIYLVLLLFPFFFSNQMIASFHLEKVYDLWRLIDFFVGIIIVFKYLKKLSTVCKMLIGMWLWLVISSIINNSSVYAAVMKVVTLICFMIIVDYFSKRNFNSLLNANLFCFEFLIYMNLLAIIFIPDGISHPGGNEKIWLLDSYAAQIKWFVPALCVSFVYYKKVKSKARLFLLNVAIIVSSILSGSATLSVTISLFYFCILNRKLSGKITVMHGIILEWIFLIGIVILRKQNYFSFVLEAVLHRSLTFTGRTDIWNGALLMISKKLLIGNGYWSYIYVDAWKNNMAALTNGVPLAGHAHCQFLYFLVQGGIIFFVLFNLFNFYISKRYKENQSRISELTYVIVPIFCLCIAGFVETIFDSPMSFLPYLIGSDLILENKGNMKIYERI